MLLRSHAFVRFLSIRRSAEVFFGGKGDAETAVSEYHEAEVDGRAMFITAMPVTPEDNMDVFSSKNSMFGSGIRMGILICFFLLLLLLFCFSSFFVTC